MWTRDRRLLLFTTNDAPGRPRPYGVVALNGDGTWRRLARSSDEIHRATQSQDHRWLAVSTRRGRTEANFYPFVR
jgi:hypothetical protein